MTNHTELLKVRLAAARVAFAQHKQSAFHEKPPCGACGGCHFWQGYTAALEDSISGEWHGAMRPERLLKM